MKEETVYKFATIYDLTGQLLLALIFIFFLVTSSGLYIFLPLIGLLFVIRYCINAAQFLNYCNETTEIDHAKIEKKKLIIFILSESSFIVFCLIMIVNFLKVGSVYYGV